MKRARPAQGAFWLPAVVILALSAVVFRPFIVPMLWALIIAYATWPAYEFVRCGLRGHRLISALAMTVLVLLALLGVIIAVAVPLTREIIELGRLVTTWSGEDTERLASLCANIPIVGAKLSALLREAPVWKKDFASISGGWLNAIPRIGRPAGRHALEFLFTAIALYFAYRHGESLPDKLRRVFAPFIGGRFEAYGASLRSVMRAVLIGVPLTAIGQAALAGLSYWASGIDEPLVLTLITAVAALVPFGAVLVWVPSGAALLIEGNLWGGVGVLLWGALVVSWIDNVIRMFVIGNAVRMPFMLALLGIVGGVSAFGLIGLFVGPLVAEMLRMLWDEGTGAAPRVGARHDRGAGVSFVAAPSLRAWCDRPSGAARPLIRRRSRKRRMPTDPQFGSRPAIRSYAARPRRARRFSGK